MKRLVLATLAALAPAAHAQVAPQDPENNGDFWREVAEPHADEVSGIVQRMDVTLQQLDLGYYGYGDVDPTGENRARMLQGFYGQLRYARKLSPDNVNVLVHLGRVADDLGKTKQALEVLTAARGFATPEETPEIDSRLGAIYLRMGDLDAAIRYLRLAQPAAATLTPQTAGTLVHLSTALALRGQMSDAIDVLVASQGNLIAGYYDATSAAVSFALAVLYDRDDDRGAAFDILDKLQSTLQQQYAMTVQQGLAVLRQTPAEDQHYYLGLLYESSGDYAEARAEWATYAAAGGAWRARALEHVAAIDAEKHAHPGVKTVPTPVPTRRRRHP